MRVAYLVKVFSILLAFTLGSVARAGDAVDTIEKDKKALMKLSGFVGGWKGTGSTKVSAGRDAWVEDSEWGWDFKSGKAAIIFNTTGGRFMNSGKITVGEKDGVYVLTATTTEKATEEYKGEFNKDGELILDAVKALAANRPSRLNLSLVAKGKRLIIQYLTSPRQGRYEAVAEMGLTLKGSGFGKMVDEKECIITGGRGTMSVSYQGKTYYVCCTGCKDAFDANPAKEIAQWQKRKAEEAKQQ